jgi:amino acid transporter
VKVAPNTLTPSERLPRTLGLWSALSLVVGITIGSGIFRSPAGVASHVMHPALMLALWAAGGLVTLCGALSIAELAAALPESGGFYAYLREGWGRRTAFLFGWSQLVLIRAAALGGVAIVFGEYFLRSAGVDPVTHVLGARALAAAAIVFAAATNIVGINVSAIIVNASSAAKFSALGVLITAALVLGGAHGGALEHLVAPAGAPVTAGGIGLAIVSILWAYDGFADLSFVAGEVRQPHKNLPAAIIGGTLAIIAIYVLANLAYVYVLPVDTIAKSPLVAADVMTTIFGPAGASVVSLLVAISTFGSLNAIMLSSPRIFFAMADDGLLFAPLARVHPRFRTPYLAIVLAAGLGSSLVLSQTFETLSNTFVLAIWPFYALSVAAIYRLRATRPDLARPYKVIGYPLVPAVFILAVVWFLVNALVNEPVTTGMTFALILAGVPVYQVMFRSASATGIRQRSRSRR